MTLMHLFLVGDVMLARGIDQILKHSCDPRLYENNGLNAKAYVSLAESTNGKLPSERDTSYVWGDALPILASKHPDIRIINLENSITTHSNPWPLKGIHYRMHPKNVDVIQAANIDCCILSNNHTIDWQFDGLEETLASLKSAGLSYAGAGFNIEEAESPSIFCLPGKGRVIVFGAGHESSGIPGKWQAKKDKPGVNLIDISSSSIVSRVGKIIHKMKQPGDIVVYSVHWGGNWGYDIDVSHQKFAHSLIDDAGVDLIHGHSSHHPIGLEVYQGKLIIYGAGDFINDYEGISGHEEYGSGLAIMYFPDIDPRDGKIVKLTMVPTKIKQFRVQKANRNEISWLLQTLSRECKRLNCDVIKQGEELILNF